MGALNPTLEKAWGESQRWDSNPQPQLYESCALPLSYFGTGENARPGQAVFLGSYLTKYSLRGTSDLPVGNSLAKLTVMEKCVQCGAELPREEMFGPSDELRCPTCARRGREKYAAPKVRFVQKRAPVTAALAALAVVVWLYDYQAGPMSLVRRYFVDDAARIWSGELWRFFTSVLPHGNIFHLLFNVYWLWMFGRAIESVIGSVRFTGLVLLVAAGPLAAQFLGSAPATAIGLSGVGYGLFGFLHALRKHKSYAAEQMQPQVIQLFIIWFVICFFMPFVANIAHAAGAAIGWLVGSATLRRERAVLIGGVAVFVALLIVMPLYMPWNPYFCLVRARQAEQRGDLAAAKRWHQKYDQIASRVFLRFPEELILDQLEDSNVKD